MSAKGIVAGTVVELLTWTPVTKMHPKAGESVLLFQPARDPENSHDLIATGSWDSEESSFWLPQAKRYTRVVSHWAPSPRGPRSHPKGSA